MIPLRVASDLTWAISTCSVPFIPYSILLISYIYHTNLATRYLERSRIHPTTSYRQQKVYSSEQNPLRTGKSDKYDAMVKKAVNGAQGNDGENTIYKVSPHLCYISGQVLMKSRQRIGMFPSSHMC